MAASQGQAYLAAARAAQASYQLAKREASEAVHLIRAFAGSQKNPLVAYNAAQIAPPAAKSPAPPPARPERVAAALGANDGSLTLTWKCSNPEGTSGTSYIVRRRLGPVAGATGLHTPQPGAAVPHAPSGTGAGRYAAARPGAASRGGVGESEFTILGIVGKKTFVDNDLPAGIESVEYTVQGQRADRRGAMSPILTVQIGRPGPVGGKAVSSPVATAARTRTAAVMRRAAISV